MRCMRKNSLTPVKVPSPPCDARPFGLVAPKAIGAHPRRNARRNIHRPKSIGAVCLRDTECRCATRDVFGTATPKATGAHPRRNARRNIHRPQSISSVVCEIQPCRCATRGQTAFEAPKPLELTRVATPVEGVHRPKSRQCCLQYRLRDTECRCATRDHANPKSPETSLSSPASQRPSKRSPTTGRQLESGEIQSAVVRRETIAAIPPRNHWSSPASQRPSKRSQTKSISGVVCEIQSARSSSWVRHRIDRHALRLLNVERQSARPQRISSDNPYSRSRSCASALVPSVSENPLAQDYEWIPGTGGKAGLRRTYRQSPAPRYRRWPCLRPLQQRTRARGWCGRQKQCRTAPRPSVH